MATDFDGAVTIETAVVSGAGTATATPSALNMIPAAGESIEISIAPEGDEAFEALVTVRADAFEATATITVDAAPALASLLLNGVETLALALDQTDMRGSVIAAIALTGLDQYGEAFEVSAAAVAVTATATMGAAVEVDVSGDGSTATLTVTITPVEDADTVVTLRVADGAVSATAMISVETVERVVVRLVVDAVEDALTQSRPGAEVQAQFSVRLVDNYGDDDRLTLTSPVTLNAISSDGQVPDFPADLTLPSDGAQVTVRITPATNVNTTLTLTATLDGVPGVAGDSASVRIAAAAEPRLSRLQLTIGDQPDTPDVVDVDQTEAGLRQPVSVSVRIEVQDQYGDRSENLAAALNVTATATAGATVALELFTVGLVSTLTVTITPDEDADTVVTVRVTAGAGATSGTSGLSGGAFGTASEASAGMISATLTIAVDAIDRTPMDISVRLLSFAPDLIQTMPGSIVMPNFGVIVIDNYDGMNRLDPLQYVQFTPRLLLGTGTITTTIASVIPGFLNVVVGVMLMGDDELLELTVEVIDPALGIADQSETVALIAALDPVPGLRFLQIPATLKQMTVGQSLIVTGTLTVTDQYGHRYIASALDITATATQGATVSDFVLTPTPGLLIGTDIAFRVTPDLDRDTLVTLRASVDGVTETVTIAIDAVDRVLSALTVTPSDTELVQDVPESVLRARFVTVLTDIYGDTNVLNPVDHAAISFSLDAAEGVMVTITPTTSVIDGAYHTVVDIRVSLDATLKLIARSTRVTGISTSATVSLKVAEPRALRTLEIETSATLSQAIANQPVTVTLMLSALDQYDAAFAVAALQLTATATAGATVSGLATTLDALPRSGVELGFQVTPDADRDTVVTFEVSAGAVSAMATIEVDAVDRVPVRLTLMAQDAALIQSAVDATVTATFTLGIEDNYGAAFSQAATVTLSAVSSDGRQPSFDSVLRVLGGSDEIEVSVTPAAGADTTLTLTASLAGVEGAGASAQVRIMAAEVPAALASLLLDGVETLALELNQAAARQPVTVALTLTGLDQYSQPFAVNAATVAATATANARVEVGRETSIDGLVVTLTVTITPDEDAASTVMLTVVDGAVSATATIEVDAVDRVLAALELRASASSLTQGLPEDDLTATFELFAIDNYGAIVAVEAVAIALTSSLSVEGAAAVALSEVPSALGLTPTVIETTLSQFIGEDFELTLEATLETAAGEILTAMASLSVDAAEPRRVAEIALSSIRSTLTEFPLQRVFLSEFVRLQLLDQYGAPIAQPENFALSVSSEVITGNITIDVAVPSAPIPVEGAGLGFGLELNERGDAEFKLSVTGRVGAAAPITGTVTMTVSSQREMLETLTLTPRSDTVMQAEPEDIVHIYFEVSLRTNFDEANDPREYNYFLRLEFADDAAYQVTGGDDSYLDGVLNVRLDLDLRGREAVTTLTLFVDVSEPGNALSTSATVRVVPAAPRALNSLGIETSPTLSQSARFADVLVPFEMSALDQYGDFFAETVTLTASVDGGAMISSVAGEGLSDSSEATAMLETSLVLGAQVQTATVTVQLADGVDATLTLRLDGAGGVSAEAQVTLVAVPAADALRLVDANGESALALARPAADALATATLILSALARGMATDFDEAVTIETAVVSGAGTVTATPSALNMISAEGESIDIEIALDGDEAFEALVTARAGAFEATATIAIDAAPALASLLLDNVETLTQALVQTAMGQPVTVALTLTGLDQYGEAYEVSAADVTATATAGARVEVDREISVDGLAATLTVTITPVEDADTVVTLRVADGAVSATATISVETVARVAVRLVVDAVEDALTQNRPDEEVQAQFNIRLVDNYGDDDRLTLTSPVTLNAISSDGQAPDFPADLTLPSDGAQVTVRITPATNMNTTLTLTATLDGVPGVAAGSDSVRIAAAAEPRLSRLTIDGQPDALNVDVNQAGLNESVSVSVRIETQDQYEAAILAATLDVTATATAGATVALELSTEGLVSTLTVTITPDAGRDTVVTVRMTAGVASGVSGLSGGAFGSAGEASAGEISATLTIAVNAVDRAPARLTLTAQDEALTQSAVDAVVTAAFQIKVVDNYGDDWSEAETVTLTATSSDGRTPIVPLTFEVPAGGDTIEVSLTPAAGADTTLTLTAMLAGVGDASAQVRVMAAETAALASLLLDGVETLTLALDQAAVHQPVTATLTLTGLNQYGEAYRVSAADVTATATANARVEVDREIAVDGLVATLTVTITPLEDADAQVTLTAMAASAAAVATIDVDAVDRAPARLTLMAQDEALTQSAVDATVTATFALSIEDNYGAALAQAATVTLSAVSSDGLDASFDSVLQVLGGSDEIEVSVTPAAGADTTLTLTAMLVGVGDASAQVRIMAAETAALASLLLDGVETLTLALDQAAVHQPVTATLTLTGLNQYGEAYRVSAADVTATATANARVEVDRETSVDGLVSTLTVTITPLEDADAQVTLTAMAGSAAAVATIDVDAVDRAPTRLTLMAQDEALTQSAVDATVTATFALSIEDNYGAALAQAATVTLSAVSSDGLEPGFDAVLRVLGGSGEIEVSVTPAAGADTTLTLTAMLAGIGDASAQVRIMAAETAALASLLLDGVETLTLALDQAAVRQPVTATLTLTGLNQYGEAYRVSAADVTATATANARVEVAREIAVDGLVATLTVTITPLEDADAQVTLTAMAGSAAAVATIDVDAVDRAPARLTLMAQDEALTQSAVDATVTATFALSIEDNYGAAFAQAATVTLSAVSSDGLEAGFDSVLRVLGGSGEIEVSVTPAAGADTTLTLTAMLAGVGDASAQVRVMAAETAALASLLLDGVETLTLALDQAAVRQPVTATLTLTGLNQYGEAYGVSAADVTATATANARVEVGRETSIDGLVATLTVTITPLEDADAQVTLTAMAGSAAAVATIDVDAVDRAPTRLTLMAQDEALTQSAVDATVTATFALSIEDNYGAAFAQAATVTLSAVSSDGLEAGFDSVLRVLGGSGEIEVSVTPAAGADTTLTLTAMLAGVGDASAQVRIMAAETAALATLLLDGVETLTLALDQAAVHQPVTATLTLTGLNQYGEAYGVSAADVTATATANARVEVGRETSIDGLVATLTVTITPLEDADAQVTLTAMAGSAAAVATIDVDAVDRAPTRLTLMAQDEALTQSAVDATVTATFALSIEDNYGAALAQAATVTLSAVSSDGLEAGFDAVLRVLGGSGEIEVSVTPAAGADTTLTLTAMLAGVGDASAQVRIMAAETAALATLLLDGVETLTLALDQAAVHQPVTATLTLTGLDQYGEAYGVSAADVTATATANARVEVAREIAVDGLVATLTVTITPLEDADAQVTLTAMAGSAAAVATIDVDAVDRAAARLTLTAQDEALTQSAVDATVTATFALSIEDNYGAALAQAATVTLSAVSSDGLDASFDAVLRVLGGSGEIEVSVTPAAGADTTLTLTAMLAGVGDASAQVRIMAAETAALASLLLDGVETLTLALDQAAVRQPVTATLTLTGLNQYGEAYGVSAADVTATATAGATVELELSTEGLVATLTVTITPLEDADAQVTLTAMAGSAAAVATIDVDAVDRAPARLTLMAQDEALTQSAVDATVTATFALSIEDNYGAALAQAATVTLSAVSSDGLEPGFDAVLRVLGGSDEIEVSVTPAAGADTTLTLTAMLASVGDASAQVRVMAAETAALASLLLDGVETLTLALDQAAVRQPVTATLTLTGLNQYGEAYRVSAADVTATTTANARVEVARETSIDGLVATLTVTITPLEDADAQVTLTAMAGSAAAVATIDVDAVDRAPARLTLTAQDEALTQSAVDATVTATFALSIEDNYGAAFAQAATVTLSAVSSDGLEAGFDAVLRVLGGSDEIEVSVTPAAGADTTLTLTAMLAGIGDASAQVRIMAAETAALASLLLDGVETLTLALDQAAVRQPVTATLTLTGLNQYGEAYRVSAADVTATATANARVEVARETSIDGLVATLTVTITPLEDADAQVTLTAMAGSAAAVATIDVDAVDRAPARLTLMAQDEALTQSAVDATVTATFALSIEDNYGAAFAQAATVTLSAVSSDGLEAGFDAVLRVLGGSGEIEVSVTPAAGADTTLTLTAMLAGVGDASAQVRVMAAEAAPAPALATLLLETSPTLSQSARFAEMRVSFEMSALDQYGDLFAETVTLTASVDGGAMISSVAGEGLSDSSEATAMLETSLVLGAQVQTATVTVQLANGVDATLTLRLEGADGVSAEAQVTLVAVPAADALRLVDANGESALALARPAADALATATLILSALARGMATDFDEAVTIETAVVSGAGTVTATPSALNMISAEGESIDIEIALDGDEAFEALVTARAGAFEATATIAIDAAPALASLLLDNVETLTRALVQTAMGQPVTVALTLTGLDQYGEAYEVSAADVTATATAGARVEVDREISVDGLAATLTVTITPVEDADTVVTLRVADGAVSATATISVETVARVAVRLVVDAVEDALTQNRPDEEVQAQFSIRLVDNYGDDDRLTLTSPVTLNAISSDGQVPDFPADLTLPSDGAQVTVRITPATNVNTTLTLTATLDGVPGVAAGSDSVRIAAAAEPRLSRLTIDGQPDALNVDVNQAGLNESVSVSVRIETQDQYEAAILAATLDVTATATAGATVALELSTEGLVSTLTVTITPDASRDTVVTVRMTAGAASGVSGLSGGAFGSAGEASAGEISATLTIAVNAVDRAPARLTLTAQDEALTQSAVDAAVTATFTVRIEDNYGAAFAQAATVTLSAVSSDSLQPSFDSVLRVLGGIGEIEVSLTPAAGADTTLTLTAMLAGVGDASAQVRIMAAPAAPALDALRLVDAGGESAITLARPPADTSATLTLTLNALAADNEVDFDGMVTIELSIESGAGTATAMPSELNMISAGGESIEISIAPEGDAALEVLVRATTGMLEATATITVPAREIPTATRLQLADANGDTDIAEMLPMAGDSATIELRLRAFDQNDQPIAHSSATLSYETIAGGDDVAVMFDVDSLMSLPAEGATITVTIRPDQDVEAMVRIVATGGALMAEVMVTVTPEARELADLRLTTTSSTLTQENVGDMVAAYFMLRAVDNYGDDDVLAATVLLETTATAGATAMLMGDAELNAMNFEITPMGVAIEVEVIPADGVDTTLTLKVTHAVLGEFSIEVSVIARPVPLTLDFTMNGLVGVEDSDALWILLKDAARFARAYDERGNVRETAVRAEIVAELDAAGLPIRHTTAEEVLDLAAKMVALGSDEGQGFAMDFDDSGMVEADDVRILSSVLLSRGVLDYVYDENGMVMADFEFLLDFVIGTMTSGGTPLPVGMERETVGRVYMAVRNSASNGGVLSSP